MKYLQTIAAIVFLILTTILGIQGGNYVFLFGILSLWGLIGAVQSDIIDKLNNK